MTAVVIDYGMGNVTSVTKALHHLKVDSVVTSDHAIITGSKYILLPGVGSFMQGMINLRERGLLDLLTDQVMAKQKPFLGICLGMQLIASDGTEPETTEGLGWIPGKVIHIETMQRIPHLGWNNISSRKNSFFEEFDGEDFYFIHSYHFVPEQEEHIAATVHYGNDLVAAVNHKNIYATQFHPEKSQNSGLKLLHKFFSTHA